MRGQGKTETIRTRKLGLNITGVLGEEDEGRGEPDLMRCGAGGELGLAEERDWEKEPGRC